ncbi:hypothetical protein DV711_04745 [Motiliproteus coralliicola]|uniref:Uncharacterized protein n=1 Tax=Motiliproteus coralliicola TaxID=2283196 RepID=A0A369WZF3_9GAMM|nr:hypothetical protein [Motiliproteus coralliicola]RDE24895.1 hypothetical protein DV711_04745 [Motiliproteus coralliicola]
MTTGLYLLLQVLRLDWSSGRWNWLLTESSAATKTPRYRAKKKIVRALWIACGILMLLFPLAHFIITLGLFTTFLSFTILDESL